MGFNEDLITKVYKNIHPINLQEAIDYMNKNNNNKFLHSFIPNNNNVCLICEEKRDAHDTTNDLLQIEDDEDDIEIPNYRIYKDSLEKYREKKESYKE